MLAAMQHQWIVYRKQMPGNDNNEDVRPAAPTRAQRMRELANELSLKDTVEFKPKTTAHMMRWDSWSGKDASVFHPRFGHTATLVGANANLLLFFGGADSEKRCLPQTVQLYDASANAWRHISVAGTAPERRMGHTACLDSSGNRLVIIGGTSTAGERFSSVDVLHGVRFDNDGAGLHWNEKHKGQFLIPDHTVKKVEQEYSRRDWCGCVPVRTGKQNKNFLPGYHADHWHRYAISEASEKFCGRSHHTCVLRGQLFYVFGGVLAGGGYTNEVLVLDWQNFGTEKRAHVLQQQTIMLPANGQKWTPHGYYRVALEGDVIAYSWRKAVTVGNAPPPLAAHAAAVTADGLFMVVSGGIDSEAGVMYRLQFGTMVWSRFEVSGLPSMCHHSITVLGNTGRLLLMGGFGEFGNTLGNIYVVDMADWSCSEVNAQGTLPNPRGYHTANLVGKTVFMSSGHGLLDVEPQMQTLLHPFDNSGFVSMLGLDLVQALDREEDADVCFVFLEEGKQIYCHKAILSCRSERMRQLFVNEQYSKEMQTIEVAGGYSYAVFFAMIKYLYCDRVNMNLEMARSLIEMSVEYGLDQLAAIATSCTTDDVIIPPSRLNSDMQFALFNPLLSDMVVSVEGVDIPCHKVILMTRSVYFKAMLTSGLREQHQSRVILPEVERGVFNAVLRFIYTDTLDASNTQLAFDLFCQASLFRISNLQDRCEQVLLECIDNENVATLYEAADRYASPLLKEICVSFINRNFADLNEEGAFDMLPMDLLLELKHMRVARSLYLGTLERLTDRAEEIDRLDEKRYIDEKGVDCPHCSLPFVYAREDWAHAQSPKEMLLAHAKGQVEFKVRLTGLQLGHLSTAVVAGKEYSRTRPYGSKRDAEQNVALFALHSAKCGCT